MGWPPEDLNSSKNVVVRQVEWTPTQQERPNERGILNLPQHSFGTLTTAQRCVLAHRGLPTTPLGHWNFQPLQCPSGTRHPTHFKDALSSLGISLDLSSSHSSYAAD
jgi:hypothetical protein